MSQYWDSFIWRRICNYEPTSKMGYVSHVTFATKYRLHKLYFSLCIAHYALSYKFSVLLLGNILRCFFCVHAICYNKLSKYYSNPSSVVLLFTFFRPFYRHFLLQLFLALVLLLLVSEFSSTTRTKMTKTAINYCVKLYTSVLKKACYKSHIKDTQISKCT